MPKNYEDRFKLLTLYTESQKNCCLFNLKKLEPILIIADTTLYPNSSGF